MRWFARFLLLLIPMLLGSGLARAEVVVVVDSKAGIERLTRDEVVNIFLGRYRKLPSGVAAVPADHSAMGDLRAAFYRKLVDKDVSEINAYWARLYFSGKTAPPVQLASASEILSHVLGTPGGIGYLERSQIDSRVKVVLVLSP